MEGIKSRMGVAIVIIKGVTVVVKDIKGMVLVVAMMIIQDAKLYLLLGSFME